MLTEHRLPIEVDGHEVSHLTARLLHPVDARVPDLCLVFLHGLGSVQEGTKAQTFRERAAMHGFAFCTFDFQGHGVSGGKLRELTTTRNLEDIGRVLAFLRTRGFRRFVLFGSSMGAFAGLWYAARHPGAIAAACHIAPGFDMYRGFLLAVGAEGAAQWERDGVRQFRTGELDIELDWQWMRDLREWREDQLAQATRTPTLLLHGCHDETIPWRSSARFAAACPSRCVDVHLFGDGDHRLTDRRDELWDLAIAFLRRHGMLDDRHGA